MSRRAAAAVAGFVAVAAGALAPAVARAQTRTIVIDPGHGGGDPGGTGNSMLEKDVVLDVSRRFRDLLVADSADAAGGGTWRALLTRDSDVFVSLAGRSAYANGEGADRFLSIHANAFSDPAAHGTETFSLTEGGQGAALRNLVQEEVLAAWGLTNRGNKTANFAVLRETSMPAELHELAFITNGADAQKLASDVERQKAAVAHLRALQRHFGIAAFVPGALPPTGDRGQVAGRVVDDAGGVFGAVISLDGGRSTTAAGDGSFAFGDVEPGDRRVSVTASGYEPAEQVVAVAAGGRADVELRVQRSGAVASLTVRVTDATRDLPLEGARVSVGEASGLTGADGLALLAAVAGAGVLSVRADGFAELDQEVELAAGASLLEVALTPGDPGDAAGGCRLGTTASGPGAAAPLALALAALLARRRRRR